MAGITDAQLHGLLYGFGIETEILMRMEAAKLMHGAHDHHVENTMQAKGIPPLNFYSSLCRVVNKVFKEDDRFKSLKLRVEGSSLIIRRNHKPPIDFLIANITEDPLHPLGLNIDLNSKNNYIDSNRFIKGNNEHYGTYRGHVYLLTGAARSIIEY